MSGAVKSSATNGGHKRRPSREDRVWTIRDLLTWTTDFFARKGLETPRLDAEVLLAHALGCSRVELYTNYDKPVEEGERARYRELVRRRGAHEPVAYLTGQKEFFSLTFAVTRDVLIPRPDSEFVVLTYLDHFRDRERVRVADVGTGSGNLAVAIAHEHAGAKVVGVDRSLPALRLARRNAVRHGVAERTHWVRSDLLRAFRPSSPFDAIVSNPPYIPTAELANLEAGVRDYEPRDALDGGPTGLEVVRRLIEQAPSRLRNGGMLILEIGAPQEEPVRAMLEQTGVFEVLPTVFDYAGHPRVVAARRI